MKSQKLLAQRVLFVGRVFVILTPMFIFCTLHALAHEPKHHATTDTGQPSNSRTEAPSPKKSERIGDVFPLYTCPVSGEQLGSMGDVVIKNYDGREVRFCCKGCVPQFEEDPASFLQKLDAAIIDQQRDHYALDYDIVQPGKKLPEDRSKAIKGVVGNRLFLVTREENLAKIEATPEAFLARMDQAILTAQSDSYPLDTCFISGDKLGGDMGKPVSYVHAGELLKLCCKGCVKMFEAEPHKYMKQFHEAKVSTEGMHTSKHSEGHNSRHEIGENAEGSHNEGGHSNH